MRCLRIAKFIRVAERDARVSTVVIMGQNGGSNCNERYGWPEMADPSFREAVIKQFDKRGTLNHYRFSSPDAYDDWNFYAYPSKPL